MAKRKRYLTEEEYTRLVNELFSYSDDSDDISKELESESFSDSSDTEILSEPEIEACMPSTSCGNASLDIFWSRTLQNLKPFHFT